MNERSSPAYVPAKLGNAGEGLIRFFTAHRTAHNLLMALIILVGLTALSQLRRQFFPDTSQPLIDISIAYPGSTALQVDKAIVEPLEGDLRQLPGVESVEAISRDGFAQIEVLYPGNTDINARLGEVQRVITAAALPEDASEPVLSQREFSDVVTRFVLTGPVRPDVLAFHARQLQAQLEAKVDADVVLFGGPVPELKVALDPIALEAANLSVDEVAGSAAQAAREISAGSLTDGGPILQSGQVPRTAQEISNIVVRRLPDGSSLSIGDLGVVEIARDPDASSLLYIGDQPAVDLSLIRSLTGDSLSIQAKALELVNEFQETLPSTIYIQQWDNSAEIIESRINLLIRNGLGGLAIVLVLLFLFMGGRSAFWVAAGIPVAILGTFAVMLALGQTINMISLFAILLSLGIIVDDAIVVAEHADALSRQGVRAQEAAMRGGIRMSGPVLASSLTTIGAFAPLFVISGETGAFILALPLVVIAVIIASLLECFLILPGHMKSALKAREIEEQKNKAPNAMQQLRTAIDQGVDRFREQFFGPMIRLTIAYRYGVLVAGFGLMAMAYVLLFSGRIEQVFFPEVEFNNIFASFELNENAELKDTVAFCGELNRSLDEALQTLDGEDGLIIAACYTGVDFLAQGPGRGRDAPADLIASLAIEMVDAAERNFTNDELIDTWRPLISQPTSLMSLQLSQPSAGPGQQSIRVRLQGTDLEQLALASTALVSRIEAVDGASDVSSSFARGAETLSFQTNAFGQALGLSNEAIGSQMRAALTGNTAYRFLNDGQELGVRFVLSDEYRGAGFEETFRVKTSAGTFAPLSDVAETSRSRGINRVRRVDGQIFVRVSGNLDETTTSLSEFQRLMRSTEISELLAVYGASLVVGGQAEQQTEFFAELTLGAYIGLTTIFIVLAWVFSSYTRPFVILLVIPFGIVGAVFGHWVLGMPLSILSYISIFGLSGIVVNDSIVLVSRIDERAEQQGIYAAIVDGAKDRLRAIVLTSVTTIGGLLPLMFETSVQAQFLIPMAVTVIFGLAFSTFLLLFFVPALVAIQADIGLAWRLMFFDRLSPGCGPAPGLSS